jgi:hypothetical protein
MRTSDPDQAGASSTFRFDATLTRCCESRSKPNKSNQGSSGIGEHHRDKTSSTCI